MDKHTDDRDMIHRCQLTYAYDTKTVHTISLLNVKFCLNQNANELYKYLVTVLEHTDVILNSEAT